MTGQAAARQGRGWALLTGLLALLVMLNYADRGAIAIAAPGLKDELQLSALGFGLAISAFSWIYAPAQLAIGWLADRLNVYRLIAAGLMLWAASTMLTAAATSLAMLVGLRLLLGLGEGVAFPAASKIIAGQVPARRRGLANSSLAAALAAGPAAGTFAGGLILAAAGWRMVFLVFGAVTLLWLLPWHFASKPLRKQSAATAGVPMRQVLGRPTVWALGFGLFCANYAFFFLLAWLPLFLVKERGFTILEMTSLTTSVYLVQALGALGFGWLSDRLVAAGRDESRLRKGLMLASLLVTAAAVIGVGTASSTGAIALWLLLAGASMGPAATNCYAIAQIFAGPRASGSWVGAMNAIGNCSGIVGPLMTGWIVDRSGSYLAAFLLAAAVSAVGALWWGLALPRIEPVAHDP